MCLFVCLFACVSVCLFVCWPAAKSVAELKAQGNKQQGKAASWRASSPKKRRAAVSKWDACRWSQGRFVFSSFHPFSSHFLAHFRRFLFSRFYPILASCSARLGPKLARLNEAPKWPQKAQLLGRAKHRRPNWSQASTLSDKQPTSSRRAASNELDRKRGAWLWSGTGRRVCGRSLAAGS